MRTERVGRTLAQELLREHALARLSAAALASSREAEREARRRAYREHRARAYEVAGEPQAAEEIRRAGG